MRYVIFGSVVAEANWSRPGANIPMTKWLRGLVDGLKDNGVRPSLIGHTFEASWPKGRLCVNPVSGLNLNYVTHPIRFSNLPFVRTKELSLLYLKKLRELERDLLVSETVLFTYNPYPWHLPAARWWQRKGGTWINIVLDYDENDLGAQWRQFTATCGDADGQVFLSWWGYENCPSERKLHLDSGCGGIHFRPGESRTLAGRKLVLYAGKIGDYGGAGLMADAFRQVPGDDVEFHICGRGRHPVLDKAVQEDSRIKLHGFVDDETLDRFCREATVFVNPRDPASSQNRLIFPSKIHQYLSYGKPVVSTWTPGLAPTYKDVLNIAEESDAGSLAKEIAKVLAQPPEALIKWQTRVHKMLEEEHSWRTQAGRLIEFAKEIRR